MKIIVTGSLGNISKPMTKELVKRGHSVVVISSNYKKENDIVALGAKAAIGKLEDVEFLASTFTGSDAVYCMVPFNFKETDQVDYFRRISNNYSRAIQKSGIKHVVLLSGWAAGIIDSYKDIENTFNELQDVSITLIRPGYFYSNFFDSVRKIKEKGIITAVFGGEDMIVFSAPSDIADAVVNEFIYPNKGKNVRYIASGKMTCNEAAKILGMAIGKPDLKWMALAGIEVQKELEMFGLSPELASDIVKMQMLIHKGLMVSEFSRHESEVINGKVKLADFAEEFAHVFQSN